MSWIKIKELRMNTDTGIWYKPTIGRVPLGGYIRCSINFNGEEIFFEIEEQRDNAIKKLDEKLNIDNLFKTDEELFEEGSNE